MLERMWRPEQIAGIAAEALRARSDALVAEQAVRGLDSGLETSFHPLLAEGMQRAGLGVFREQPYPGERARRPRHAERERCDLVLTRSPGAPLIDPVAVLKATDAAEGTLFEAAAPAMLAAETGVDPADAFWLEVKVVGQFCFTNGVPGPNRAYSSELLRISASDIPKLSKEERIRWSGVLLILFTADEATAKHDFGAFMHKCIDRDLPVGSPALECFAIPDLIGNARCTVAVVPVKPLA
jgi:hypothetical protein